MGALLRLIIRPLMRPFTRLIVGLIAIPIFRLLLRRVVRLQDLDQELEKDLEQWFRGSVLLLFATANMEEILFGFLSPAYEWLWIGLRVLLAVGVIEAMPDQALFAVIHPGPPRIAFGRGFWKEVWRRRREICKGILCKHLSRASPVFAILCVIVGGAADRVSLDEIRVGWICYILAIVQYLIIGLVTSRDRALDVLSEFDRQVAKRRQEIVEEFHLKDLEPAPPAGDAEPGIRNQESRIGNQRTEVSRYESKAGG